MLDTLLPLAILVFLSNTVESAAGFGATILALTFGASLFPIEDLVAILVPLNLLLSMVIVMRHRTEIRWPLLLRKILPLTLIGLPIGIYLYQVVTGNVLKILFAAIVIVLSLFELARGVRRRTQMLPPLPAPAGYAYLFFGGVMQGLYASGGPFIVYYTSRTLADKAHFRTTLSALWMILNFFVTGSLIYAGKLTPYTIQYSGYLLPFVLAGLLLGLQVHRWISEERFRVVVYTLLLFAGVSLLYRSIT